MKGSLVFLVVVFAACLAITALWQAQLGLLLNELRVKTRVVLGMLFEKLSTAGQSDPFSGEILIGQGIQYLYTRCFIRYSYDIHGIFIRHS